MRKFRNASLAILTAGALALSATPAMAEDTAANPAVPGQVEGATQASSNTSSKIGTDLEATPEERAVWGSEKGSSYETGEVVDGKNEIKNVGSFTKGWYAYTWIATVVAVVATVAAALPQISKFINIDFRGLNINIPGIKF